MGQKACLILLFGLWALPGFAQVHTAWERTYDGPGNWNDLAADIAVDDSGNVYVTGSSLDHVTEWNYGTVKYDPNGNQLWAEQYDGPSNRKDCAYAMVLDDSGNVYVTGYSDWGETNLDYLTIKYHPDGGVAWARRYNGPGDTNDVAVAMALDDSGNVYVTGYSWGIGTFEDYATIKHDSDGSQLWVRRYNGTVDFTDQARAIAVDRSGNVLVTGMSLDTVTTMFGPDSVFYYVTIKYDTHGNQQWLQKYNGPGNGDDKGNAIAVDGSNNVYVTGRSYGGYSANIDFATVKYEPNGNELWVRRYTQPSGRVDYPSAIAVDGSGNVYVAGHSAGSFSSFDYAIVKYSTLGDELWVQRYNGNGNYDDIPFDMVIDSSANVYVTGRSAQSPQYPVNEDYITIKYDSSGSQIWLKQYDGPSGGETDEAKAVAVTRAGHVYVTGESNSTFAPSYDYDFATVKYFQGEVRGDANGDGVMNVSDVIYLVNYLFRAGDPPDPVETGDVNCDETTDVADVLYLVNYLYRDGPLPCGI